MPGGSTLMPSCARGGFGKRIFRRPKTARARTLEAALRDFQLEQRARRGLERANIWVGGLPPRLRRPEARTVGTRPRARLRLKRAVDDDVFAVAVVQESRLIGFGVRRRRKKAYSSSASGDRPLHLPSPLERGGWKQHVRRAEPGYVRSCLAHRLGRRVRSSCAAWPERCGCWRRQQQSPTRRRRGCFSVQFPPRRRRRGCERVGATCQQAVCQCSAVQPHRCQ